MIAAGENPGNIILEEVPGHISDTEILHLLYSTNITWKHVDALKTLTEFNDEVLSDWLGISVKTFREYKKPQSTIKENVKEQVLVLLSLMKHGVSVFGSMDEFEKWLYQENFFLDYKSPISFLNTITGIKFIDDRLTALQYGDNV
jgi:uncharacterized protein (DUF2384 family)